MFKYIAPVFVIPCMATAQQNETYYAAPYLEIKDVREMIDNGTNDFGYNINLHKDTPFLREGYYMWVDDQWYEIINASDIFVAHNDLETLFTITKDNEVPLKIKDVNDVIYLYPIEALDTYKVSLNDFTALSKNVEKRTPRLYEKSVTINEPEIKEIEPEEIKIEELIAEDVQAEDIVLIEGEKPQQLTGLPQLNPLPDEEVMITSEDPASVLLDVMEVVEIVKREEVPFEIDQQENPPKEQPVEDQFSEKNINTEKEEVSEQQLKPSAADALIIPNPSNDYEVAVNEGFDGTVTEWVEMIGAQGGKSAYEQAVDKGFEGSEREWMRMLWGRQVDVEVAKRDKTTAIVTEWIQSLQTSRGNSPYELALRHGFYGTFTEWIESVIGTDGEKAYEHAKTKGFEGTYEEWIEKQLDASNQEVLRKELLTQTQMFVAPNIQLPLKQTDGAEPLEFNLYNYYNQYYGSPVISSGNSRTSVEIKPADLEYQITWFERDKIKIIELNKDGVMKYLPLEDIENTSTSINVRYLLK
ncbi:MAG TPA: hypothetical protein VKY44_00950 [Flavobacterium sp.]|nr:hypothetical protein [Flavobacterium sp.]